jgi:hypothetical protein
MRCSPGREDDYRVRASTPATSAPSPFLAGLLTLATFACSRAAEEASTPVLVADPLDSLRVVVHQLSSDTPCEDAGQCRAVAFGSKPCGGPWSYLIYSTLATDSARLSEAVALYNAREAELNRQAGRVSDCRSVAKPALGCVSARCQAASEQD